MTPPERPDFLKAQTNQRDFLNQITNNPAEVIPRTGEFIMVELDYINAQFDRGLHQVKNYFLTQIVANVGIRFLDNPSILTQFALMQAVKPNTPQEQKAYQVLFENFHQHFGTGLHNFETQVIDVISEFGDIDPFAKILTNPDEIINLKPDQKSGFSPLLMPILLIEETREANEIEFWHSLGLLTNGALFSANSWPLYLRLGETNQIFQKFSQFPVPQLIYGIYLEALLHQFPQFKNTAEFVGDLIDEAVKSPLGDKDEAKTLVSEANEKAKLASGLLGEELSKLPRFFQQIGDFRDQPPGEEKLKSTKNLPLDADVVIWKEFKMDLLNIYLNALDINLQYQKDTPLENDLNDPDSVLSELTKDFTWARNNLAHEGF